MSNSMMVLFPYRRNGIWMFDDAATGLTQEPFVFGIPEMIDMLAAAIPNAEEGFALYFSAEPFPHCQMHLEWQREEYGGNWYRETDSQGEGWLCPALFKYFSGPPLNLYVRAEGPSDSGAN